jgi:hypothetical protein
MKCADCQVVLAEFAIDALEPRESEQVVEHLAGGCDECQQQLEAVRAEWAALADGLPPVSAPAQLKNNLLARIGASSSSNTKPRYYLSPEPEPVTILRDVGATKGGRRWQSILPYVAASLCGIALGYGFARGTSRDPSLVERYNAQLSQAEQTFGAPQMRFAALRMSENRPEVRGYLIWDSVASELHVYAFDLGPPPDGFAYQLWIVSDNETWIAAGDLQIGPNGVGTIIINVPALTQPSSRVVVTTEPINRSDTNPQQRGPVGLVGEFPK